MVVEIAVRIPLGEKGLFGAFPPAFQPARDLRIKGPGIGALPEQNKGAGIVIAPIL